MKTKISLFALSFLISDISFSQTPAIQWQNDIGGSDYEGIGELIPTSDGGYIIGGSSFSGISGDKTEASQGGFDYWVLKLNAAGNIVWQNTIGGNGDDLLYGIDETSDGGYIIGGNSASGISGDKTEAKMGANDYWILKLDATGNITWQNTIGGNSTEYLSDLHQTSDGGYIVAGESASNISGDKTENRKGPDDYWILKLDASGNIIWQNTIGGNSTEAPMTIEEMAGGGYMVGGYSYSGISGDKTEINQGGSDFWIFKLDAVGNIVWQNTIGGNNTDDLYDMQVTSDGGCILGGYSLSGISGDKNEGLIGGVNGDYWVVKTDSLGNIQWQNDIGGSNGDGIQSIQQMLDGEYIIAGYSQSCISGDHTDACMGGTDYWIVKLNTSGAIVWNNDIGGNFEDKPFSIRQTSDLGFIIGGLSTSNINGDKTESLVGGVAGDIWVVKLFPDCIPFAEICNGLDDNCNGLVDDGAVENIFISAGGATTFCQGGNVLLTATYSGTTVQWYKDLSPISGGTNANYSATQTGTYSCTTTGICGTANSTVINVLVNKNPKATISAGGPTTFCTGGSVTLTETPSAGCSYQWYKGASAIAGATTTNYMATTAGNYKCRVTKTATGCYKNSSGITVTVPCRENDLISDENTFTIYPNPASDFITIPSSENIISQTIEIIDVLGRTIEIIPMNKYEITVDVSKYAAGIYFVKMEDGMNASIEKFIKQ